MKQLVYLQGRYRTAPTPISFWAKTFPSLTFYTKFFIYVLQGSVKAKRCQYGGEAWSQNSLQVLRALERVGITFEIRGIDHLTQLAGPGVFIANHMSILETVVLPAIIQPIKPVTFVVKQSLLQYPVFKHIIRSRDPIGVSRKHPRNDFKAVMQGGLARLNAGISIVIFPQTTRTASFDPTQFNTLGIKLARKARVPVIPIALVTDAWGIGKYLKDFGKIDPAKTVLISFGDPLWIQGQGAKEHAQILEFIATTVRS